MYGKCSKFQTIFSFFSQMKQWISGLELRRSSLVWICPVFLGFCGSHRQATTVQNFRTFTVNFVLDFSEIVMISGMYG